MAPLITLLVTFALARVWAQTKSRPNPNARAARFALAAMLTVTGIAHFVSTEAMAQMVPPFLPGAVAIIYATGVLELAAAALLLKRIDRPTPWLGWVLASFFMALLPANIYSAVAESGLGGHGAQYLWFRIPLQVLFIGWALMATGAVQRRRTALTTT